MLVLVFPEILISWEFHTQEFTQTAAQMVVSCVNAPASIAAPFVYILKPASLWDPLDGTHGVPVSTIITSQALCGASGWDEDDEEEEEEDDEEEQEEKTW